jgi:mRNA interferase RelE/StbE
MKYILVYTSRAVKDISRLDSNIKTRIKESLEKYAASPISYARKMVDPVLGTYRFRVGDYRIIFDIAGNEIVVLRVGHRKDIFRGR